MDDLTVECLCLTTMKDSFAVTSCPDVFAQTTTDNDRPLSVCLSVCLTIKIIIDRQNITTQMARLWVQSVDNNWWNICTTVMISEYSWPASVIMSSYVTFRLVITVGVNILFFYRVFVTSAHIGPMAYLQSLCCAWWFSFDRTRTNG